MGGFLHAIDGVQGLPPARAASAVLLTVHDDRVPYTLRASDKNRYLDQQYTLNLTQ